MIAVTLKFMNLVQIHQSHLEEYTGTESQPGASSPLGAYQAT